MLNLILIVLISLLPLAVTWITSPEEIFIKKEKDGKKQIFRGRVNKSLSLKGKVFVATIILTALFAFFQFRQNQKDRIELKEELALRDSVAKKELFRRDSISQNLIAQSKNETIEALAKYGLKYDSAKKEIITFIKDSTNKKNEKL